MKEMITEGKKAKEISLALFGVYKKAVIYRLLKEADYRWHLSLMLIMREVLDLVFSNILLS
jgi:hypothetical protein